MLTRLVALRLLHKAQVTLKHNSECFCRVMEWNEECNTEEQHKEKGDVGNHKQGRRFCAHLQL